MFLIKGRYLRLQPKAMLLQEKKSLPFTWSRSVRAVLGEAGERERGGVQVKNQGVS